VPARKAAILPAGVISLEERIHSAARFVGGAGAD
jgi:hypothetical protein